MFGGRLPDDDVLTLGNRTEGWFTGLQLAALSLREHHDIQASLFAASGSNRYIVEYLTGEVLQRQPPDIQQFLLTTSILNRLHGPLCHAITERTDSTRLLEHIAKKTL